MSSTATWAASEPARVTGANVAALGGGHGLAVTLRALRRIGVGITAIVGTGDDGGSSGRLRQGLGILPPGDMRMALAALVDESGPWPDMLQHRFDGSGESGLEGHAMGNVLMAAAWREQGDPVAGLEALGSALRAQGRVLPNCREPVELIADVEGPSGGVAELRGQARITLASGRFRALRIVPADPIPCHEAIAAIEQADAVVLGPGSWFTSVLSHFLVPGIRAALQAHPGPIVLVLNSSPEEGETEGFAPEDYLTSWRELFPEQPLDLVVVPDEIAGVSALAGAARALGADLLPAPILDLDGVHHDPARLATALAGALGHEGPGHRGAPRRGRMTRWP